MTGRRFLQPNLNSSEVTLIFAQPLISFLSSTPHLSGGRTADPSNPYYTFTDVPWSDDGTVRLHKFLTGREGEGVKPVFGVTSSVTCGYIYGTRSSSCTQVYSHQDSNVRVRADARFRTSAAECPDARAANRIRAPHACEPTSCRVRTGRHRCEQGGGADAASACGSQRSAVDRVGKDRDEMEKVYPG